MRKLVLALGATALLAVACSNSESSTRTSGGGEAEQVAVDAPGVTDSEIRVGGVASVTNPLGGEYGGFFEGAKAYLELVNEEGGVHGREIVMAAERDDKVASNDVEVGALLTQDEVFAVLPIGSLLFTGADRLVEEGVPTFGWQINEEWAGTEEEPRENLFGHSGSYLGIPTGNPTLPYIAQEEERTTAGLLAYSVPQSADCLTGAKASIDLWGDEVGLELGYEDAALAFGVTDLSVQVSNMKQAGVDIIYPCMDLQGVVTLAKELKKQGSDAIMTLPNAYDRTIIEDFGDLFQGAYIGTAFAPFETDPAPEGLEKYLAAMEEAGLEPTEPTTVGWLNAALFVEGLREAGPDFDRQKVIDAINEMTDWTAEGMLSGVDWTTAHFEVDRPCTAFTRVEGEEFVPALTQGDSPFVCLDRTSDTMPEAEAP